MIKILYCSRDETSCKKVVTELTDVGLPLVETVQSIDQALDVVQHDAQNLGLIATAKFLADQETAWELVDEAREMGYEGPVVYLHNESFPQGYREKFTKVIIQGSINEQIGALFDYIMEELIEDEEGDSEQLE